MLSGTAIESRIHKDMIFGLYLYPVRKLFFRFRRFSHNSQKNMDIPQITMLGTGNAVTTKCYNTCFILRDRGSMLLVDGGGGNGILVQMEKAGIRLTDIHDIFITHAHTDHIFGAIWAIRFIMQEMLYRKDAGPLNVYGNDKVMDVLTNICRMTLHKKYVDLFGKSVLLHELKDRDLFSAGKMELQCFDIQSAKERQLGFRTVLSNGQTLVCLGDEPFNESTRPLVENADWLMCEAFCLYDDREIFRPYEKSHSTALDTGITARGLNIKNLILYHTEDSDLSGRKERYTAEAGKNFRGKVYVPDDLETICLE